MRLANIPFVWGFKLAMIDTIHLADLNFDKSSKAECIPVNRNIEKQQITL